MVNKIKTFLKHIPFIETTNRLIKARLQERYAAQELAEYEAKAKAQGLEVLEGAALQSALATRLKQRGIVPTPRAKGDMHVYLTYREQNWEECLPRSLAPFGKLSVFEALGRGFDEMNPNWLQERDEMNRQLLADVARVHAEQPIDVFVGYVHGLSMAPETLQRIGEMGIPIINFCWDDKLKYHTAMVGGRWQGVAAIAAAVDLNLTNAKECRVKYVVDGGLAMFWPEAADPTVHRRYDVPFDFDVSFVGVRYGYRKVLIDELTKLGVHVECFGKGWGGGYLPLEDMIRTYSRSRINIGLGGVGHSNRLLCLKGRDFEVPMSGGLYLAQHNPEFADVFEIGKEIVTWKNPKDCAATIKHLLANPEEADRIREAGYQRSLREHSWEYRFATVFQFMGALAADDEAQ